MRLASWVITAALLAVASPARADDDAPRPSYRVVLDRVDQQPAAIGGSRLTLQLSALSLQGQRLDLSDPKTIKTYVGASPLSAPYALGTYGATNKPTAIVIVVQNTIDFGDVLPVIVESLDQHVLSALGDEVQLALLSYGDTVGSGKLATVKSTSGKLRQLSHDGSSGDPALIETVERALRLLRKAKTVPEGRPLRKMILVIGDGRDRAADRDRVTRLGKRAAKEEVRIHSFAYSPTDQRRELLTLGELSRQSLGTFRWLRTAKADSWVPACKQLEEEINKQYVLTYFLSPDEDPAGRKVKVVTVGRAEATSNDLKVPESLCHKEACAGYCTGESCAVPRMDGGRGILGWILLIVGIIVGLLLVLSLIGFLLSKRSQRIPLPPGFVMPGVNAPLGGPGVVPGVVPGAVASTPGYASQPPAVAPAPVAAPVAKVVPHLMFLNGPRAGQMIPLRHGFMIGKAANCDLVIEDGFTSGHHAQIGMDTFGNCRLFDRESTNGTFVNGVRVTEYALDHGVSLKIGSTELRFLAQ